MRLILTFFLISIFSFSTFSQNEKLKFPFNEVVASVNKIPDFNSSHRGYYGFGIGLNRSLRDSNRLGVIIGVHFTHTKQSLDYIYRHHQISYTDVFLNINSLSIPYYLRFKMGKKKRFFVELGVDLDLIFASNTTYSYYGFEPYGTEPGGKIVGEKDKRFKENLFGGSIGIHFGVGKIIEIKSREFMLLPEFDFGFTDLTNQFFDAHPIAQTTGLNYGSITIGYRFNKNAANSLVDSWINQQW